VPPDHAVSGVTKTRCWRHPGTSRRARTQSTLRDASVGTAGASGGSGRPADAVGARSQRRGPGACAARRR
jgi:hypothetical protein